MKRYGLEICPGIRVSVQPGDSRQMLDSGNLTFNVPLCMRGALAFSHHRAVVNRGVHPNRPQSLSTTQLASPPRPVQSS